jgi:tRNA threonylcarbamoyl adenosine modification protein (Sua5/YciO/YrdC/YwlC family)
MAGELIKMYPDNPKTSKITHIVDLLKDSGVIIYPTDTIYGLGCDIFNAKAIEKVCRIKGMNPRKVNLSFICYDLSDISNYVRAIPRSVFKVLKKALPGPFTFIMNASSRTPKYVHTTKKTVGIRIPDNNIPRDIVRELGNPIITTSLKHQDEIREYLTDPNEIFDRFKNEVEVVIDGGPGNNIPSTVVDCTNESFSVLRQGMGNIEDFL